MLYFPKLDVDIECIKSIVLNNQFNRNSSSAKHHRLVSSEPYLTEVQRKYPFLTDTYNIYTTLPFSGLPRHVDAKRKCALNIPLKGTDGSETIFYSPIGELITKYDPVLIANIIVSDVEKIYSFTLTEPVVINNTIPHEVVNNSATTRVIMSWSISNDYTFEDVVEIFKRNE